MRVGVCRLLVIASLLLGACATESAPAPTPSPVPPGTVVPPPGFVAFRSRTLPYESCYPQGWQVNEDWVGFGRGTGDAFVGGQPREFPDVVSIIAEPAEGLDTARYMEVVLTNLRGAGRGVERTGSSTVNGTTAERLRFARATADEQRYSVQQIVWAQYGRGWVIAVSSPPANEGIMEATLATIAACFRSPA